MGTVIRILVPAVLLFPALVGAQNRPSFQAQPGRVIAVVLPKSVLSEPDVARQMGSGLTTTFVLSARQRDADRGGLVRLEVRFDLWDEVWLVKRIEFDGKTNQQRISSRESLEAWWIMPVRLFNATTDRVALTVTLTVLPFSVAEGEDARKWIAESGGLTGQGGSPLVSALLGTTLSARPIRSYRWPVEIAFP